MKTILAVLVLCLTAACATPFPARMYNNAQVRSNQQSFNQDFADCQMQMMNRYESPFFDAPDNYALICMQTKGWHR